MRKEVCTVDDPKPLPPSKGVVHPYATTESVHRNRQGTVDRRLLYCPICHLSWTHWYRVRALHRPDGR
jgi:hypothetical protein